MTSGTIHFSHYVISFSLNPYTDTLDYSVYDTAAIEYERLTNIHPDYFFHALASVASGTSRPYPLAERAVGTIRWIPN